MFRGHIVSEDRQKIVFQYVDNTINISTTLTFSQADIHKIERDQPVEDTASAAASLPKKAVGSPAAGTSSGKNETFLAKLNSTAASDDPSLPGVYVVPMKGQMGTDIELDIYKEVVEDIQAHKPDLIVWVLDCADSDELMFSGSDARERGLVDLDKYLELVNLLKDDLRSIPQIMWVQDSVGISSVIALAWSDMYMHPHARLTGLRQVYASAAGWSDEDAGAKMIAAWVGKANGFLANGGYPLELGKAMMNPENLLSATWKGREVEWKLAKSGEYLVDDSDERTASFRAKTAEDFCLSDGTAENIDDLMLLYGYREFRLIDGQGPKLVEDYIEDWRRLYENTKTYWSDYEQHSNWASGEETLKYLGRAKGDLQKIIAAMDRYPAIETRWESDAGVKKFDLITMVEQINEQIRAMRQGARAVARGGAAVAAVAVCAVAEPDSYYTHTRDIEDNHDSNMPEGTGLRPGAGYRTGGARAVRRSEDPERDALARRSLRSSDRAIQRGFGDRGGHRPPGPGG